MLFPVIKYDKSTYIQSILKLGVSTRMQAVGVVRGEDDDD